MATRNFVPRANGEGSIGKSRKHWGAAYIEKIFVKAVEVLGGETENDAQPATIGWVKSSFSKILETVLGATGLSYSLSNIGYIKLGALFGGVIIQWGATENKDGNLYETVFPIEFTTVITVVPSVCVWGNNVGLIEGGYATTVEKRRNGAKFKLTGDIKGGSKIFIEYIAIGY